MNGLGAASAAASAARSLAAKSLSECTVFVKVSPLPITFAERRAVLHAMKKHGRIEVFKKIPHSPASFISVTETEEAAQKLVAASPLTYELLTTPSIESPLTPKPTVMPTLPQHIVEKQAQQPGGPPARPSGTTIPPNEDRRQFVVHMFPSPKYNHMDHISRSPLHGPWKPNAYRKQSIVDALMKNIPRNVRQAGLAEWDHLDYELEEPPTQALSMTDMWSERERKRREADELPGVYKGLLRLQQEVEELRKRRILGQPMTAAPGHEDGEGLEDQPPDHWLDTHEKVIQETKKSSKAAKNGSGEAAPEMTSSEYAAGITEPSESNRVAASHQAHNNSDGDSTGPQTCDESPTAAMETEAVPSLESTAFFKQTLEHAEKMEAEQQAQSSAATVVSQLNETAQAAARDTVDRSKPDA